MYLIAGLGNIGDRFLLTRHNIGFETADYIAAQQDISFSQKDKFKGMIAQGTIAGKKVLLVKPSTYMNLSGECIRPVMDWYGIEPEELIVIHDDVDFAPGIVKVRKQGGAGTHNGMKDIVAALGTGNFARIRIGVGTNKKMDLADYVLSRFLPEELPVMREAVITAADAVMEIVENGIDAAMNKYNTDRSKQIEKENKDGADDLSV